MDNVFDVDATHACLTFCLKKGGILIINKRQCSMKFIISGENKLFYLQTLTNSIKINFVLTKPKPLICQPFDHNKTIDIFTLIEILLMST